MANRKSWDNPAFDDFFEDLNHRDGLNESLEILEPETFQGGLTSDNVHRLSEDLMNPIPPSDNDSQK